MFSKMRKVKCPDGSVQHVYKDPNQAFPLAFIDLSSSIKAELDAVESVKGSLSASNEQRYNTLLFSLDQSNNTLQANYAAAYIVYAASPCHGYERFANTIERLERANGDLAQLLVKVRLVQDMIRGNENPDAVRQAITSALEALKPIAVRETNRMVQEAPATVQRWGDPA